MKTDTYQEHKSTTHKIVNIFVNTVIGLSVVVFILYTVFSKFFSC